ncbi:pseudouridine synthase [Hypoxylon sp. FL1150]|nr:pseudouridine synthase [Hypoxylon sp. FL1150]
MATHTAMAQGSDASVRSSFEQRIGILHYVSQKEHGWHGHIRTRFTDFQVHEISKAGEVVHLHDFPRNARELSRAETSNQSIATPQANQLSGVDAVATAPKTQDPQQTTSSKQAEDEDNSFAISPSDRATLADLLGQDTAEKLIELHNRAGEDKKLRLKDLGTVDIAAISDKSKRSQVHSEVRRIFGGRLDTATGENGSIRATVVSKGRQQRGNRSRNERPRNNGPSFGQGNDGKFLHFTLYKENRDTMDAIGQIARLLNLKPSFFGTAGTKDRRAVTTQRVSMRRRNPQTLVSLNNDRIYGVKIGDFKFENFSIHLGHHSGNEFVIVAKNCQFSGTEDLAFEQKLDIAKATIESALDQVNHNGFINYYGTQRFGTHQIGTQEIGMKILKQDFEGAVQALLSFDPSLLDTPDTSSLPAMRREDASRARACSIFTDTGNAQDALSHFPRRCHVESTLIRHLSRQPKDFVGALLSISRGMRTMYVHAYQSLVWNFAASKRWELFGTRVVMGDLVLVESETSALQGDRQNKDDDEEMIHLMDEGPAVEDTSGLVAHVLTEEEATSGKYTIFDVVLPSPGWDVVYPDNEIGRFYKDFMAKEENGGLDPQDMLRRQRDFSLPGSYRKLMGKFISTPSASVQAYLNDTDQLVPTDLDLIRSRKAKETAERASAQREISTPQISAWQAFANNAREIDRQIDQERAERRKAEESSETPEIRAKDTWVQTSLDGSNKRVKISTHTDEVQMGGESGTSQPRGDETIVDIEDKQGGAKENVASQTSEAESANQDSRDSSSLVSNIITQVRDVAVNAIQLLMKAMRVITNTITFKRAKDSDMPESQLGEQTSTATTKDTSNSNSQSERKQSSDDKSQDTTGGVRGAVDKPEQPTPSTDSNEKKIAVILRFALNTSQYATIVLRELQGTVPAASTTEVSDETP